MDWQILPGIERRRMTLGIEKLIKPRSGFQTSVNLAYDLERADKIKDFVPTKATMKVLEKLMLPTASGVSERAHILIGAYGKGKSHLVLVLLAMLAHGFRNKRAVVSGTALIRPDFPELLEFPFLWQQVEYVLGGGSSHYMFLVLAARHLL